MREMRLETQISTVPELTPWWLRIITNSWPLVWNLTYRKKQYTLELHFSNHVYGNVVFNNYFSIASRTNRFKHSHGSVRQIHRYMKTVSHKIFLKRASSSRYCAFDRAREHVVAHLRSSISLLNNIKVFIIRLKANNYWKASHYVLYVHTQKTRQNFLSTCC